MRIKDLLHFWDQSGSGPTTATEYAVKLSMHDAARVHALAEMYGLNESRVITDLISSALDELAADMPYVQGGEPIGEDELGDPIYPDAGPITQLHELTEKHLRRLGACRT